MDSHRLALKPGYVLEHFRIERVLGKGGFGITYLAVDIRLGKRVAIKELLPDTIATRVEGCTVAAHSISLEEDWQWAKERFMQEAQMLAGFSHPTIVGVHWLSELNGTVYMVMDYVEGETYAARLQRIGTEPDEASLIAVMGPVLEGLKEVHAKGLLHRDIKPENILIKKNGRPVLIDFGAARESVGQTVTMTSMVTHGYSPIEQYQSKGKMGPWTDIYAVGALMCRAMTGEKPPVAADRLMEEEFEWLSYRVLSGYSAEFRQAVDWALRVKPQERPQSVENFLTEFERLTLTDTRDKQSDHPSEANLEQHDVAVKGNAGDSHITLLANTGSLNQAKPGSGVIADWEETSANNRLRWFGFVLVCLLPLAGALSFVSSADNPFASRGFKNNTELDDAFTKGTRYARGAPSTPAEIFADVPYAVIVPGKPGFVTSPHAPNAGFIDVRGFERNTEVNDPYTNRSFLVP